MFTLAHSRLLGIAGGTLVALSLSSAYAQSAPPYDSPYRGYAPSPYAAPYWQDRGPWFVPQYGDPYGGGYGAPQGVMPPRGHVSNHPLRRATLGVPHSPTTLIQTLIQTLIKGIMGLPLGQCLAPTTDQAAPMRTAPRPFDTGTRPIRMGMVARRVVSHPHSLNPPICAVKNEGPILPYVTTQRSAARFARTEAALQPGSEGRHTVRDLSGVRD